MNHTPVAVLRSVLYVPASNTKALGRAPTLGADALILDLEDSVAPQAKETARGQAHDTTLALAGAPLLCTVRINGLGTDLWSADVDRVFPARVGALVVPKVERVEELAPLDHRLGQLEAARGDDHPCPIWPMIETPLGVINAFAIASHPRVACLVMGVNDLAHAMRLKPGVGTGPLKFALQQTILAARAAGRMILDGVFVNIRDPEGYAAQCRESALLGFDGKTIIHPSQVEPANLAFGPGEEEIARAEKIVREWEAASSRGEEICVVDGQLVERLHADQARRILAMARLSIR
ncbi:MAG: CoA ester lyase [Magnetococcales bacterium]|nr:CoA ester lyase [Magnetococcales bacterium]MBF0156535.1 CoA ester lyase [Magnetococcales bacterium]